MAAMKKKPDLAKPNRPEFASEQAEPSKTSFLRESWGTIANLLVTIFVGAVVAVYLQFHQQGFLKLQQEQQLAFNVTQQAREQSFMATQQAREQSFRLEQQEHTEIIQKQIIELERQSTLANITVGPIFDNQSFGADIFTIDNDSLVSATNIKLAICLDDVYNLWKPYLKNISQFDITVSNQAIQMSREDFFSQVCRYKFAEPGNNATLITIDSLAPKEHVQIYVYPATNHPKKIALTELVMYVISPVNLYTPEDIEILRSGIDIHDALHGGLDDETNILTKAITFGLTASCDNCTITSTQSHVSLNPWQGYGVKDLGIIEITDSYIKWYRTLSIEFDVPAEAVVLDRYEYYFLEFIQDEANFWYGFRAITKSRFDEARLKP